MSLDVYLELPGGKRGRAGSGIFIREDGATREISRQEWDEKFPGTEPVVALDRGESTTVYDANITHNLNKMASEAGIYRYLWRPDEIEVTHAHQLIEPLKAGLKLLKSDRVRFEAFNPINGWGNYDGLVCFIEEYLSACEEYPQAEVSVSR